MNVEEPPKICTPFVALALMLPDAVIFPKKLESFMKVLKGPIINVVPTAPVPIPVSPPVEVNSDRGFI